MTRPADQINKDTLKKMRATLADLPAKPKTTFTCREAIAEMADDIRRARDELGYSLEDIARMLAEHGHAIKPATLRGYLRDLSNAKQTRKATRKKKTSGSGQSAAPAWNQAAEVGHFDRALSKAPVTPETPNG